MNAIASMKRWGRRREVGPFDFFTGVIAIVVAILVIYPLARMIIDAFLTDGRIDLSAFAEVAALPGIGVTLINTVIVVGVSGAAALFLGAAFAWLNERTDARMGWVSEILPVLPLLIPTIATSVGWVFLLSPRAGVVNTFLRDLVGSDAREGPLNIFTRGGMIFLYRWSSCRSPTSRWLRRSATSIPHSKRPRGHRGGVLVRVHPRDPARREARARRRRPSGRGHRPGDLLGAHHHRDERRHRCSVIDDRGPAHRDVSAADRRGDCAVHVHVGGDRCGVALPEARTKGGAALGGRGSREPHRAGEARPAALGGAFGRPAVRLVRDDLPSDRSGPRVVQPFWTGRIQWDTISLDAFAEVFVSTGQTQQAIINSVLL